MYATALSLEEFKAETLSISPQAVFHPFGTEGVYGVFSTYAGLVDRSTLTALLPRFAEWILIPAQSGNRALVQSLEEDLLPVLLYEPLRGFLLKELLKQFELDRR